MLSDLSGVLKRSTCSNWQLFSLSFLERFSWTYVRLIFISKLQHFFVLDVLENVPLVVVSGDCFILQWNYCLDPQVSIVDHVKQALLLIVFMISFIMSWSLNPIVSLHLFLLPYLYGRKWCSTSIFVYWGIQVWFYT